MSADLKIAVLDDAVAREFRHDNIAFGYYLIREDRKTIAVAVWPSQDIVVKAPLAAADERVDEFLQRKFRWILKQKRYFAQFKEKPGRKYVSGETFRYRGRSYKLLIKRSMDQQFVSLRHGTLFVFTNRPDLPAQTRSHVEAWYCDRAHTVFAQRLEECLSLFDYEERPGLMIKNMTRRWGSYSQKTKRVILNQDLIKAATRYIDYVVVHELCHITHREHNRAFFELLASKLPHWQRLKSELELSLLG